MLSRVSLKKYKYRTMRRKSLISRGGHIGITLLRQTVTTVIFTVPINFIHIQSWYASKVYQAILRIPKQSISPVLHKLDKRAESTRRNHTTMQKPVYAGHPVEDSTLCWMYGMYSISS